MLYIEERTRLKASKRAEYLAAAEKEQIPLYYDLAQRLVGYWETVPTEGYWPEVISVWELDDFDAFGKICQKRYSESALGRRHRDWQDRLGAVATESHGALLWPSSGTPSLEKLKGYKHAPVYLHESITTFPNKSRIYIEQFQKLWGPTAARYGRRQIGIYAEVWHAGRATNIWAFDDWDVIGKYQGKMSEDPDARTWQEAGRALRTDWDDRLVVALPFSPV